MQNFELGCFRPTGPQFYDVVPDLQHPENPLPLLADPTKIKVKGAGD
jgi:hypothetical protein